MADERNRWLDQAAAERLLRGEPAEPVGPAGAEPRARVEAARLRAALDALETLGTGGELPSPGTELPGEAAAVAAFRTARTAAGRSADRPERIATAGSGEPVVDLGRLVPSFAPARPRRRGRTVSFGLAAALASVAVGGLAAAAGAGLLDRDRHDTAGPGPAMSVTAGENAEPDIDGGAPTLTPKLRPTPLPDGSNSMLTPGPSQPPGTDGRTTAGSGTGEDPSAGSSATGGSGKDTRGDLSGAGGTGDKDRDTFGNGDAGKDERRERENLIKALDLCQDYRSGRLDDDRRERLSRLADGLTRIPDYCKSLLERDSGGKRSDTPLGDGTLKAPTLAPAAPRGSTGLRAGL
ncbi:hypothetical protein PV721_14305 [Streptomyces sp. MB09-01]|uniref:hypothetical protein n=1 Tax=Streptomyces sp. MB09-01 TaxID=3028666 RepID=UPI0029B33D80|nr:hypothetical protein [Streptomyces sp. MB09-01]MDX3535516.1 hypothetical protein [Streptomyces sp. MB09-01]